MVQCEGIEERLDERPRILVRHWLARELHETRDLDEGAPRCAELEQRPEARFVEARIHRGTTAVIDQDAHAGIGKQRHHANELVVLDLDIHEHVELDESIEERLGVAVVIDAVVRDVPCHADHSGALEPLQVVECRVVAHHGDTLVTPRTARDRIEHAGIVEPIARVRADQERVARPVGVHHLSKLRRGADLLAGRRVMGVGAVGKAHGIEDVHVAVDLRLGKSVRSRLGQLQVGVDGVRKHALATPFPSEVFKTWRRSPGAAPA